MGKECLHLAHCFIICKNYFIMKHHLLYCTFFLLLFSCNSEDHEVERKIVKITSGKLVYHHYTCYDCLDSELFLYDFATDDLQNISQDWSVRHPINANLSNDGRQITFMGIAPNGSWDIYIYTLGAAGEPVNITNSAGIRDEDPKFSFDGKSIVFKQGGQLALYDVGTNEVQKLTNYADKELSMPYFNTAGNKIICSIGGGYNSSIGVYDIASKTLTSLYDRNSITEYYPVTLDDKNFYYSAHLSTLNRVDQLYLGFWDGSQSTYLPFNNADADYSDACPVDGDWVILSSTRTGTKGGYDLYMANKNTGDIYSLSEYNNRINTSKWELGASYAKH